MRFLGQCKQEHFVGMFDIFSTDTKIYCFLEEFNPNTLYDLLIKSKLDNDLILKWVRQMADAFAFMHRYAIAHLNIRPEHIIVSDPNNIKIVGLDQSYFYFNLDLEAMRKAPKMTKLPGINDHLPYECFIGDFQPRPADSWSFGLLIYETYVYLVVGNSADASPLKKKILSKCKIKDGKSHFEFDKINNAEMRNLVEKLMCEIPLARPRFDEVNDLLSGKVKSKSKK